MRTLTALFLAAALAPSLVVAAPKAPDAPSIVAEQYRRVEGGRAVQVGIAQTEIETSIDVGRVAAASGGDLIGALIVSGMDDKRQRLSDSANARAEAAVAPLRDTLAGFDVDALALAATTSGLSAIDWFQPQGVTVSKEVSPAGRSAFAFAATTPQVAFVNWRYSLSPDFTQIRVTAEIMLQHRTVKGKGTTAASPLFYRQTVTSIVQLGKRSYGAGENVALWNANRADLAKTALKVGFAEVERLIPYTLGLGLADVKAFTAKDREKGFGGGFYGPLVARDADNPDNLLIWTKDGLVHIRTLPAA